MHVTELGNGIYVIITELGDSRGDSNFGLITYDDGAVLIDNDIRRYDEMMGLIRQVTDKPVRYLINTHDGFDHTSANTLFSMEGTVIIASPACRNIMSTDVRKTFKEKMAADPALSAKYDIQELSLPDITVKNSLTLHLGAKTIDVTFVGCAHTPGDVVVYLPEEQILFGGDVLFNACHPVTHYGNTAEWIEILDRLAMLPISLIVPGHGAVAEGKQIIETLRQYFVTFRTRMAEIVAKGVSVDEAQSLLSLPEYEHWGKKNWIPSSVKKIYSELNT